MVTELPATETSAPSAVNAAAIDRARPTPAHLAEETTITAVEAQTVQPVEMNVAIELATTDMAAGVTGTLTATTDVGVTVAAASAAGAMRRLEAVDVVVEGLLRLTSRMCSLPVADLLLLRLGRRSRHPISLM